MKAYKKFGPNELTSFAMACCAMADDDIDLVDILIKEPPRNAMTLQIKAHMLWNYGHQEEAITTLTVARMAYGENRLFSARMTVTLILWKLMCSMSHNLDADLCEIYEIEKSLRMKSDEISEDEKLLLEDCESITSVYEF